MASTTANKVGHIERTAAEPRDKASHLTSWIWVAFHSHLSQSLFTVVLRKIDEFLSGQWLDVYCPGVPKAGGFTITSPPSKARPSSSSVADRAVSDKDPRPNKDNDEEKPAAKSPGYLELAVQNSPANPPAAWLWQGEEKGMAKPTKDTIIDRELRVRVGGSFVWPPPGINVHTLRRVVFVAGGVGINPLISMASSLVPPLPFEVKFLYSTKDPLRTTAQSGLGAESKDETRDASRILFLDRLVKIFGGDGETEEARSGKLKGQLKLFLTGGGTQGRREEKSAIEVGESSKVTFLGRRMGVSDVEEAVGEPAERRFAVVYVCGVPNMTDTFVEKLRSKDGLDMEAHRVLCEKWW
ncbi:uncharacterized protein PG998_008254 [Apiospora kogelbergensis]|uniref:uncharacterized protein n=1 Tax=Apiospora kogelbergensis TaxID=1337665 RepID=UPI003131B7EE